MGCRPSHEDAENVDLVHYLAHQISAGSDLHFDVNVKADLRSSTLTIDVHSDNKISNEAPLSFTIAGNSNRKFLPTSIKKYRSGTGYRLIFEPISNYYLYHNTGFKGQLEEGYTLQIDNYSGNHELTSNYYSLSLQQNHQALFERYSHKKPYYYLLDTSYISEVEKQWLSYLAQLTPEDSNIDELSFMITENELLCNGILVNLKCYLVDSILKVNLRLVNHGQEVIKINEENLAIKVNNEVVEASEINQSTSSSHINRNNETFILKGQRYLAKLQFHIGNNFIEEFSVHPMAFTFATSDSSVFQSMLKLANWEPNPEITEPMMAQGY